MLYWRARVGQLMTAEELAGVNPALSSNSVTRVFTGDVSRACWRWYCREAEGLRCGCRPIQKADPEGRCLGREGTSGTLEVGSDRNVCGPLRPVDRALAHQAIRGDDVARWRVQNRRASCAVPHHSFRLHIMQRAGVKPIDLLLTRVGPNESMETVMSHSFVGRLT